MRKFGYEGLLALFSMAWGVQLTLPGLIDFHRPGYRVMAMFAPHWLWGGLVASAGALLFLAMGQRWQWCRMRSLSALFILWLAVAVSLGLPNWTSTGFLTYFFVTGVAGIAHMRARRSDQQ